MRLVTVACLICCFIGIVKTDATQPTWDVNEEVTTVASSTNLGGKKNIAKVPPRKPCGGNYDSSRGREREIRSPNYPLDYPDNISCTWNIQAQKDEIVYLKFLDFETEPGQIQNLILQTSVSCRFDVLGIFEENFQNPRAHWRQAWGLYCGNKPPPSRFARSAGSKIVIHFISDDSETRRGFRAKFYFHKYTHTSHGIENVNKHNKETNLNKEPYEVGFGSSIFGENQTERIESAFTTIVFFLVSIIFCAALMNCRKRSMSDSPSQQSASTLSAGSLRELFRNRQAHLGGQTSQQSAADFLPPTYEEIIKTDEDLHAALERIGTTEEELQRQRDDDLEVTYDIMNDNTQPQPRSSVKNNSVNINDITNPGIFTAQLNERVMALNITSLMRNNTRSGFPDNSSLSSWSQSSVESGNTRENTSQPSTSGISESTSSTSATTTLNLSVINSSSSVAVSERPSCCSPTENTSTS